jgi:hypothetical protein
VPRCTNSASTGLVWPPSRRAGSRCAGPSGRSGCRPCGWPGENVVTVRGWV